MDTSIKRNDNQSSAKLLSDLLFSLNIGFAVSYALFAYVGGSFLAVNAPERVRDFLYSFNRLLVRIAPLVAHQRTREQVLRSVIIREGIFAALLLAIALVVYWTVRQFERTASGRVAFAQIAGLTALSAVPVCWLYIVYATWLPSIPGDFWSSYGYISILEIAIAGGLIYVVRNQNIWLGIVAFGFHYLFWVLLVVHQGRDLAPFTLPVLLSLIFPYSGIAWLSCARVRSLSVA